MPYKSVAQMRFMHAKKPMMAKKWDAEMSGKTGMMRMKVAKKKRKGA